MARPGRRAGLGRPGPGGRPGLRPGGGRWHNRLPHGSVGVNVHGHHYNRHYAHGYGYRYYNPYYYGDSLYYQEIPAPVGAYSSTLPSDYETRDVGGDTYYYVNNTYYKDGEKDGQSGYVVAEAPKQDPKVTSGASVPDPFKTLQAMCGELKQLKGFSFVAADTMDEVANTGAKVQMSSQRAISVARPDKAAATITGDSTDRTIVYDGKAASMLDRKKGIYAVAPMPATLDAAMDRLAKNYGVSMPLSDLFYANAYDTLTAQALTGQYLGKHMADGTLCHHLAFTQDAIDWEIWIDSIGKPLPRKLSITYKQQTGNPRYAVTLSQWNTAPAFAPGVFEFTPPKGARKIDILPMVPASEKK